jgi:hypothetical protein
MADTLNGYAPIVFNDTIPGSPFTPHHEYWFVLIATNEVGADTLTLDEWTLTPPTSPTDTIVSAVPTAYTATITGHFNFYGFSSPRGTLVRRVHGTTAWLDSIPHTGFTPGYTGNQTHVYTDTGLLASTAYDYALFTYGYTFLPSAIVTVTTDPTPTAFDWTVDTAYADVPSSNIVVGYSYSNVALHYTTTYTIYVAHNTPTAISDWYNDTYIGGVGSLTHNFALTDTGNYYVWIDTWDDLGHHIVTSIKTFVVTTPIVPPLPMPVAHITPSFNCNYGDLPTIYFWSENGTSWSYDGGASIDSGHFDFTVPVLADMEVDYVACNSTGCDTAKCLLHVIDIPNGIKTISGNNTPPIYPNPMNQNATIHCDNWNGQTFYVKNITGVTVLTIPATGPETTFDGHSLPPGMYVLLNGNNKYYFSKQ